MNAANLVPLNRTLDQELMALVRGASLECLVCGDWITAVDFIEGVCSGDPAVGNPMSQDDARPVQADGSCFESREPGHLDPVTISRGRSESATGHAFISARALERERTLVMIRRCAERQW